MPSLVPLIEVAHHAHYRRVRRPDRKTHTGHSVVPRDVRPQRSKTFEVGPLAVQINVEVADQRRESIGVFQIYAGPAPYRESNLIAARIFLQGAYEESLCKIGRASCRERV